MWQTRKDNFWDCLLQNEFFDIDPNKDDSNNSEESSSMLNIFSDGDKGEILGNGNTKPSIKQGMDPFKYLCCWKAQTQQCRTLCFDTYSTEFSESFHSFEMRCLRNSFEQDLIGCFEDSDGHQCQHRCQSKSLEFCRVFEKITLPLRNCRSDSDLEAQNLFSWWKESGVIDKSIQLASSLSNNKIIDGIVERKKFQREIRGRNFDHLEHFWRLLACQIKLRPCSKKTHRTLSSCHRNCRKLLGLISDKTKVIFTQSKIKQKYQSIQNDTSLDDDFIICDLLQSLIEQTLSGSMESVRFSSTINVGSLFNENDDKCLDFDEFFQNKTSIQTFPSKKNDEGLKESKQICSTNHDCFVSDCPRRRCKNFCTLGKLQQFRIIGENHINLPVIFDDNNDLFNRNGQCFHRCYCNRDGHLVDCHYRSMCPLRNSTQILVWKKSIHQQIKCMFECSRETKKSPLCIKGLMYYNRCYGKCFKSDDELQSFMIDSDQECQTTPIEDDRFVWMDCLRDSSDMKSSQKCYFSSIAHLDERNEDLYQRIKIKLFDLCLNSTTSLHREDFILRSLIRKLPICDDLGGQFESICHFYRKIIQSDRKSYNASISYFGRCRLYCSLSGPVCGRDQRTYRSECAAQSNLILVDYFGECHKENRHCPRLPVHHRCPPEFLQSIPFNRCLICASIDYLLYDRPSSKESAETKRDFISRSILSHKESKSLVKLTEQLRSISNLDRCDLFIVPIVPGIVAVISMQSFTNEIDENLDADDLNSNALCQLELSRLIVMIKNRSPLIQLQHPLSLLHYDETVSIEMRNWSANFWLKQSWPLNDFTTAGSISHYGHSSSSNNNGQSIVNVCLLTVAILIRLNY